MRKITTCLLITAAAAVVGCGGGTSTPTPPPPPPSAPVASVSVSPASAELDVGQTRQLTAQPRDADGNSLSRTVSWQSSSAAVATVSNTGLVTAVSAGSAQITATSEGKSASAAITVKPVVIAVASVGVTPATAEIEVGETSQLTAAVLDAQGEPLTGRTVAWASTAPAVATVSAAGLVTAVAPGTATITATSEGKSGSAQLVVTPVPVANVTLEPASFELDMTESQQLTATAHAADGSELTGRTITWSSSDATIASVDGNGVVTPVAPGGPVTITATIEGKSASASVTVVGSAAFFQIATGQSHTCGLTYDGTAWCWGYNNEGRLGTIDPSPQVTAPSKVNTTLRFVQLAAHSTAISTCGLTAEGKAWCWGWNGYGQLGDGTLTESTVPVEVAGEHNFTDLGGGHAAFCAIDTQQDAWCWGRGTDGQLGNGTESNSSSPVKVTGGIKWAHLEGGTGTTCGLDTGGTVYCWGRGSEGQLGNGTSSSTIPAPVAGGHTFTAVAEGSFHVCALKADGSVYCWGLGTLGMIGDGAFDDRDTPTKVIGGDQFTAISAGVRSNCGITVSGIVKCWGNNEDGALGNGGGPNQAQPVAVVGGHQFSQLARGNASHHCGVRIDDQAMCWGFNIAGQLGIGNTTDQFVPTLLPIPLSIVAPPTTDGQ